MKQKALKVETDSLKAADEAEANANNLRIQFDQVERALMDKNVSFESLKWKASDYANQIADLKNSLGILSSKYSDQYIHSRIKAIEEANFEKKRLGEQLEQTLKKLDVYMSYESSGSSDIMEELKIYKVCTL